MKVLVFYSSLGGGHLSGGKLFVQNFEKQHPGLQSQFVDVRAFMSPTHEKLDRNIFWTIVKRFPNLYTDLFKKRSTWFQSNPIEKWNDDYPLDLLEKAITDFQPDLILSTHYGAAISLVHLKQQNRISNKKLVWLHTDFFSEFLPEISKHVDHTYLMHPGMKTQWLEAGVEENKISTFSVENDFENLLTEVVPEMKGRLQILITSGLEGVGPVLEMTKAMLKQEHIPLDITIVCGRNKSLFNQIWLLQPKKSNHHLKVTEHIPYIDHLNLMKSSHIIITKAGGVSTFEILNMKKPLLLMKAYGGHEFLNAEFLEQVQVATRVQEENINAVIYKIAINQKFEAAEMVYPTKSEDRFSTFIEKLGKAWAT